MSCELQQILNAFTLIKETSSRLEKDKILKGLLKSRSAEKMLREMLIYTFHPYWNYWVKVKDTKSMMDEDFFAVVNEEWYKFKKLLDRLRARTITGDRARSEVEDMFEEDLAPKLCDLFGQILNRDLKIGMQLKSFEKHLGELVPKFSPMLAATWDRKEIDEKVAIEPKLDGLRCIAIFPKNSGSPTLVSRNGRPIYNTENIIWELENESGFFSNKVGTVFDGELIGIGKSWGSGISAAHSKNKKVKGLQFVIFDMLTQEEWEKKKCYREYDERRMELEKRSYSKHTKLIPQLKVGRLSSKEIKSLREDCIENGLEGIVIKNIRGRYTFKRSDEWLKDKFKDNVDCRVVGRIEGKHRNVGKLGALIVEGTIDGQKFRSEVGQGFTDKDRKYFWKMNLKELTQLVVEVEHYGLTGSLRLKQSDKLPAIRNGVFLQVREDKMER